MSEIVNLEDSSVVHYKDPDVITYDNVLTDEECEHFIKVSKPLLKRALVSDNKQGVESQGRTGSNAWVTHNHDETIHNIAKKIAVIVGLPLQNAEKFQVVHYNETEQYRLHYDSWTHDNSEKTLRCMRYGGARLKTALCYLNDVPKGGGTKMTKLNLIIKPEKGKILVFQNTISITDHDKHPLSEHAALPVEEGEKYAVNLWFRECSTQKLYSDYNPDYYKNTALAKPLDNTLEEQNVFEIKTNDSLIALVDNSESLHDTKEIFKIPEFLNQTERKLLLKMTEKNTRWTLPLSQSGGNNKRKDAWVSLNDVPEFKNKLEKLINIDHSFFENINVVEYLPNNIHRHHFNAYDLTDVKGKEYTKDIGQRLITITLFLTNNINIEFPSINLKKEFSGGDMLLYKNICDNSLQRDTQLGRVISSNEIGYIANIYVRQKNRKNKSLIEEMPDVSEDKKTPDKQSTNTVSNEILKLDTEENTTNKILKLENYTETLNHVLDLFEKNEIDRRWNGYKSFKYNFKGNFDTFKGYVNSYNKIRKDNTCLNMENVSKDYDFDEKYPIQKVNNVFNESVLKTLQKYYKETISAGVWPLGDKQSQRYKAHNEPMSRFLHYEILPLLEKIIGKSLIPTYTYLSAYVKGSDLPPHTDRADCEYSVSFIIDKPKDSTWNIYVHKLQQQVKYKGRYNFTPPNEECIAVDCDAGGLMIFQGTDRIHYREELKEDYYNIVLLHYRLL